MSLRPLSLRKNFAWTLLGNFAYGGSQWAMLIIIAKLSTPETVGRFVLALAVTAPAIMFANMNLRAVMATDASKRFSFDEYIGLRVITTTAALFVILCITAAAGWGLELSMVIVAVAAAKAVESISDVFYGLMQQHERMDSISVSLIIKGLVSLTALSAGIYLTGSIFWGTVGLAAAWTLPLVLYDIPRVRSVLAPPLSYLSDASADCRRRAALLPRFNPATLKTLALLALPLGIATLLASLLTNIPRYFIQGAMGERALGIFGAMSYVIIIGARVITALGESASPRLAKYHASKEERRFTTLLLKTVGIGALLGAAGVAASLVAGKEILTLLYSTEYAEDVNAFVWLMTAAGIGYAGAFLQYGITAARDFKALPIIQLVSMAVLLFSCAILIPAYGILGASIALALSSMSQFIGNAYVTRRIILKLRSETA